MIVELVFYLVQIIILVGAAIFMARIALLKNRTIRSNKKMICLVSRVAAGLLASFVAFIAFMTAGMLIETLLRGESLDNLSAITIFTVVSAIFWIPISIFVSYLYYRTTLKEISHV